MKVYAVTANTLYPFEDCQIKGIFSTKDSAIKYIDDNPQLDCPAIEEHEVDGLLTHKEE